MAPTAKPKDFRAESLSPKQTKASTVLTATTPTL